MGIQKNYFSKMDLSKELGVSLRSIDNWLASGMISYSKIGRRVIFSKEDIDEFITRNKRDAFSFNDENFCQSLIDKNTAR